MHAVVAMRTEGGSGGEGRGGGRVGAAYGLVKGLRLQGRVERCSDLRTARPRVWPQSRTAASALLVLHAMGARGDEWAVVGGQGPVQRRQGRAVGTVGAAVAATAAAEPRPPRPHCDCLYSLSLSPRSGLSTELHATRPCPRTSSTALLPPTTPHIARRRCSTPQSANHQPHPSSFSSPCRSPALSNEDTTAAVSASPHGWNDCTVRRGPVLEHAVGEGVCTMAARGAVRVLSQSLLT